MSINRQLIRGNTTSVEAVTQLAAQFGFDTTKKEPHVGDGATAGGIRLAKKNTREILVAAQLVANANDYNPAGMRHAGTMIISTDASRDLTGLAPSTVVDTGDGREIVIYNGGGFNAVLKDQNAASAAVNRFDLGGADLTLSPKTSATLRYRSSGGLNRWELVAQTAGAAVGAGAVLARTLAASSLGFTMVNGTIVASVAGSALTIVLKTLAGADPSASDPVLVLFRDAALAAGDYAMMSVAAATSVVISSGSSMGAINSIGFSLWLVGFNDAGTFRLGAINTAGNQYLGLLTPDALVSSTAEGGAGAADNAGVIYTGAAVASKPMSVLGRLDWPTGLAAVGTWNAGPTAIELSRAPVTASHVAASAMGAFVGMVNGTVVSSVAGSALTIALKTLAGNDPTIADPVHAVFRNATAATGDYTVLPVTAATSLVISSGSAMGVTANSTAFRLWLVGFNDAGTFRLGAINCLSGTDIFPLAAWGIASSTAEGGAGAADSAQVFYTGTAVVNKAYVPLAYMSWETGLAAFSTWSAGPTRTQLFGHGVPLPGTIIGQARSASGAVATGSTILPADNTIPQNTEGDQYLSKAITPSSAANILKVSSQVSITFSVGPANVTSALFQDSAVNALAAVGDVETSAGFTKQLLINYELLAGAAAATTFKIRVGGVSAGTMTFNGTAGAGQYGGVTSSYLKIEEVMA